MKELPFPVKTSGEPGAFISVFEVPCCCCGDILKVVRPTHLRQAKRIAVENKIVARALDDAKWVYKNDFRRPTCPKHILEIKVTEEQPVPVIKEIAHEIGIIPVHPVSAPRVEVPRQPNLVQRRKIAEALDMAYDVDKGRYTKNFSDDSLAKNLSVPRKWVSDVREFMYGVGTENEGQVETLRKLEDFKTRVTASEEKIFEELAKIEKIKVEITDLLKTVRK